MKLHESSCNPPLVVAERCKEPEELTRVVVVSLLMVFLITNVISDRRGVSAMEVGLTSDLMSSSVTAMYVLGDSSVDCGDDTPFHAISHGNLSMFPCNGSDTTLLPQILATKMGLPRIIPFYSQNGSIQGIRNGINFGSAEASILYPGSQSYQSLNQQLRQAFETIQLLQIHLGEKITSHFIKASLFYLSFGKDDFINYFLNNSSQINRNYSGENFSHILVGQMSNAIRDLYSVNVRKIIVAGILPLGCTPNMLLRWDDSLTSEKKGCFDEVNVLVQEYNTKLEQSLVALNKELSDSRIVFCDIYRAMMEFVNNHMAYGIVDAINACCGQGKYGGESGCLSPDDACNESSSRMWWDFFNPTPVVNTLLADSTWSGRPLSAICRPITVQELFLSSS